MKAVILAGGFGTRISAVSYTHLDVYKRQAGTFEHMVNFASYSSESPEIIDNSGLMALKLLLAIGVKHVYVAGMDGYSGYQDEDYYDRLLSYDFSSEAERRNSLIGNEIKELGKKMDCLLYTSRCV